MPYTLYIPAADGMFQQRIFETLKELTMWSVAEALSVGGDTPTSPTPPTLQASPQTSTVTEHDTPKELPALKKWSVDPTSWFVVEDKDNPFKNPTLAQDWMMLGQEVLKQIKSAGFRVNNQGGCSTKEYQAFLRVAVDSLDSIGDELLPESSVKWGLLPPEFKIVAEGLILDEVARLSPNLSDKFDCKGLINHELWANCVSFGSPLSPSTPFTQNYFKIYRFFNEKKQHTSWNRISIDTENLHYDKIDHLVNKLVGDWWAGSKASDEVRELMLKLIITQNFEQSIQNTLIGASEFRTSYFSVVQKISDLPPAFLDWATQGTTFAHCKKALSDLGIPQIRRADGQKFANLKPINVAKASFTFAYDGLDGVDGLYSMDNFVGTSLSDAFSGDCFGGSSYSDLTDPISLRSYEPPPGGHVVGDITPWFPATCVEHSGQKFVDGMTTMDGVPVTAEMLTKIITGTRPQEDKVTHVT
jgi:hypothetical protein